MKVNKVEFRVEIDVDGTLIDGPKSATDKKVKCNYYGMKRWVVPYLPHIELLKSFKIRGYQVRVHSANGVRWAKEVVEKLRLKKYVDIVEAKTQLYVDDKPADDWKQRVFIGESKNG